MKHVVELKYTNPAHEHVSLRRRVETVNRVVEAQSADEALNRAANQQRSLGFRIQSANIVEQKEELSEAVDYKALEKPTYLRIKSGETKPVDRTDYNKPTFLRKKEKEEKPKSEEVEQIDEGATHWEYSGTVNGKDYSITVKRGDDLSSVSHKTIMKQNPHLAPHEAKAVHETSGEDEEHVEVEHEGKKYTHHVTNHQEPRMIYGEEVEQIQENPAAIAGAVRGAAALGGAAGSGGMLSRIANIAGAASSLQQAKKDLQNKNEEVEQTDEGVMDALKKAQVKWKTAHRAVYGKDPSAKSMAIGAVARLVGAKPHTARSVSTQIAGKPVTAQQQAAAKARAGKMGMARMRSEEKETAEKNDVNSNVKGKIAADKMSKKAAEIRKSKIEGSVNQINLEPSLDLHRPASLDPNKRIQK